MVTMRYLSRSLALATGLALSASSALGAAVDGITVVEPITATNTETLGPRATLIVDVAAGLAGAGTITDGQQVSKGALIGLDATGTAISGVFLDISLAITPQAYADGGAGVDDLIVNLANVNPTQLDSFLQTSGVDSWRLIVTTADVTLDFANVNGVQTTWNADEAVDQCFGLDRVQPNLSSVIVNTAGTQVYFVFSEGLNTGNATNDVNQTVIANIDGTDFQVSTDNGASFPNSATLLTNPAFVGSGNSIIRFDRAASSNVAAGSSFVRPAYTGATPPAVNNDVLDFVKNQATINSTGVTTQVALAVVSSEFVDSVDIGGGNVAGALRVTFNNPITDAGTADAYSLRRLNASGSAQEASTLVLSNPTIDPNDPFSVLLDVANGAQEGVAADGKSTSSNTVNVPNLASYMTRVDATTGTTDPTDVFGGVFATTTDLATADGIEPSLLFVAFGDTTPVDGNQDTVYFVFDEPMGNITSTSGFTMVRQGGVTVQPFQLITDEGGLTDGMTVSNATPANNNLGGLAVTRANIEGGGVPTGRDSNNAVCVSYDTLGFDWNDNGLVGLANDPNEAIPSTGNGNVVQGQYVVSTGTIVDASNNTFTNGDTNVAQLASVDRAAPRLAVATVFDGDNMDQSSSNRQLFTEQDGDLGEGVFNRRLAMCFGEDLGALNDGNVNDSQVTFGTGNFNSGDFLFVSDNCVTFITDNADNADQLVPGVEVNILAGSGIVDGADNEAASSETTGNGNAPYLPLVSPVDPGSSAIFAAFLADVDNDGFADQIRINMNQRILASSVSASTFSITPGTITGAAVDPANQNVIVITLTDGVVSMNNTVSVTYNGGSIPTQVTSDSGVGGTGIAVSAVNVTFDAQRVPESEFATQSPAIMDIVGVITDGTTPLPAGTKIYAMIATPVVKRITATHNNNTFVIDSDEDSGSTEAFTNWLFGFSFARNVYLGRDEDNYQFYRNYKDLGDSNNAISTYKDVIGLNISARSITSITFTGRGETSGDVVANGRVDLVWDVLRSSGGLIANLYRNGFDTFGTPITSRAVVTGDDGRFELHVSAPISAFNGSTYLNSIGRPIILIVETTAGKRFAVTSLLTSVNGGPLLFNAQNRIQNSDRSAVNATTFNINIANVGAVNAFPGWNMLGFNRVSGFATTTSTRPVLPTGITTSNIVTTSSLPFVGPLEQFVYWYEDDTDEMWLSSEDSDFSDIVIDSKCIPNFAFTMTSFGVQIGSGINNIVGGYGIGFFLNTSSDIGIFQFGAPLTGSTLFSSTAPFPNSSTTQGWGLFTAKQAYVPATSIATGNTNLDFIIVFRNNGSNPPAGRTQFEVSSLDVAAPTGSDNPNDTEAVDAGQAFFGHFR
jgi:hypothetical protein